MNKDIFFRVDGNNKLGLGHLIRCSTLARLFSKKNNIIFICKFIPIKLIDDLNNFNIKVSIIKSEKEFIDKLNHNSIVILDNYEFNAEYQLQLKKIVHKVVCIDDLHDNLFTADLVINHTPGITKKKYSYWSNVNFALGPEYALLRPAFINATKIIRKITKLKIATICFGGGDEFNYTLKTLQILVSRKKFSKINVIVGSSYNYTASLNDISSKFSNVIIFQDINEVKISKILLTSDLAIVPASSILYECIACGILSISCCYVKNQKEFHDYLVEKCNIPSFSNNLNLDFNKLDKILENEEEIFNQNTRAIRSKIGKSYINYKKIFKTIIN